jgi:hypothetical protein
MAENELYKYKKRMEGKEPVSEDKEPDLSNPDDEDPGL